MYRLYTIAESLFSGKLLNITKNLNCMIRLKYGSLRFIQIFPCLFGLDFYLSEKNNNPPPPPPAKMARWPPHSTTLMGMARSQQLTSDRVGISLKGQLAIHY